jgi:hypothetical protein
VTIVNRPLQHLTWFSWLAREGAVPESWRRLSKPPVREAVAVMTLEPEELVIVSAKRPTPRSDRGSPIKTFWLRRVLAERDAGGWPIGSVPEGVLRFLLTAGIKPC